MERHITDKQRDRAKGSRLREYVKLEKQAAQSERAKVMHRQPHAPRSDRQTEEFLRIARGETG